LPFGEGQQQPVVMTLAQERRTDEAAAILLENDHGKRSASMDSKITAAATPFCGVI